MESQAIIIVREVLFLLVIIFVAGMLAGKLAHYLQVPDVAIYLLAGILVGPVLHIIQLPANATANQLILILGATLILFDGGRGISFQVLKEVWPTILLLSIPGVLITAAVTGVAATWFLHIPLLFGMLLAAIIASTDPATLIPVFRQVHIIERVKQTVESESAFNDATGSIVTFAVLGIILGTTSFSLADSAISFMKMSLGGLTIGLAVGLLSAVLMAENRFGFFKEYPSVTYTAAAIGSYYIADRFGFSGFMATFTAGIILGNHGAIGLPVSDRKLAAVGHFYEGITLMMRMLIFVLLGSQVNFGTLASYWLPGIGVVAVLMFVARPLTVLASTLPDRKAKWKWNEIVFMFWVRETGVIPAALVGMIAGTGIAHIDAIASVTFMAILITIVIQASTTRMVAHKLGLIVKKDRQLRD